MPDVPLSLRLVDREIQIGREGKTSALAPNRRYLLREGFTKRQPRILLSGRCDRRQMGRYPRRQHIQPESDSGTVLFLMIEQRLVLFDQRSDFPVRQCRHRQCHGPRGWIVILKSPTLDVRLRSPAGCSERTAQLSVDDFLSSRVDALLSLDRLVFRFSNW